MTTEASFQGLLADREAGALRPILVLNGSAYAGRAVVRDAELMAASPDARAALVAQGESLYVVRRLDRGLPVWREFTGHSAGLGRVAWSEDGCALALHLPDEKRLEFWSGMVDTAKNEGSTDLGSIEGNLSALAVSSDGKTAFAALQTGESSVLYLFKPGESPRMLFTLGRVGALLLSGGSLYVADRGRVEVLRIRNWDFSFQVDMIATAAHGVFDPVGLALPDSGKLLWIADSYSRQVVAIDTDRSTVKNAIELDFRPSGLETSGRLLLVNGGSFLHAVDPARVALLQVSDGPLLPASTLD